MSAAAAAAGTVSQLGVESGFSRVEDSLMTRNDSSSAVHSNLIKLHRFFSPATIPSVQFPHSFIHPLAAVDPDTLC